MSYNPRTKEETAESDGPGIGCGVILGALFAAVVVVIVLLTIHRVDPGYAGVVVDYGAGTDAGHPVIRSVATGEYFFTNPFTQRVVDYPISQNILVMVRNTNEGQQKNDDSVECEDRNGIPVHIDSRTYWRIDPAVVGQLYLLYPNKSLTGDNGNDIESTVIRAEVKNAIVLACSQFTYDQIYGPQRAQFFQTASDDLSKNLKSDHVFMDRFVGGEIYLNQDQANAVNAKATAQQQAEAASYLAQRAKAEADAAVAKAEGDKQVAITQAEGQAQAISVINQQLAKSPEYVNYLYATKWDGKYPSTVIGSNSPVLPTIPIAVATPTNSGH